MKWTASAEHPESKTRREKKNIRIAAQINLFDFFVFSPRAIAYCKILKSYSNYVLLIEVNYLRVNLSYRA